MRVVVVGLLALLLQGCGWYYLKPDPNALPTRATAPAFALPSSEGSTVTLDDLRAKGHVVLVFYRGRW